MWTFTRACLAKGDADVLVCASIDRLCHSIQEFALLVREARKEGWTIDLCGAPLDVPTLFTLSLAERKLASDRTRRGLQAKRAYEKRRGVPRATSDEVIQLIRQYHAKGWSKRKLSRKIGVTRRTVTKYTKGDRSEYYDRLFTVRGRSPYMPLDR